MLLKSSTCVQSSFFHTAIPRTTSKTMIANTAQAACRDFVDFSERVCGVVFSGVYSAEVRIMFEV